MRSGSSWTKCPAIWTPIDLGLLGAPARLQHRRGRDAASVLRKDVRQVRRLNLLALLLWVVAPGLSSCSAEMVLSHLGRPGPPFEAGVTPSSLGWGTDERAYPDKMVINPKDGAELVWVPAGEFTMGAPGDEVTSELYPQHSVTLPGVWVYRTEVTNEQYGMFVQDLERARDHSLCFPGEPSGKYHTPAYWTEPELSGPRQAVCGVDWYDAYAYAAWAGARLPREAEWEKASRGTDGRRYPWGNDWDSSKCNSADGGRMATAEVGSYPDGQSPCGCLDMAGNVWEWCADRYDGERGQSPGSEIPQGLPVAPGSVLRGGSWTSDPDECRSVSRSIFTPLSCSSASCNAGYSVRYSDCGFRCVVSP